jgi:hypothetical protein
MENLTSITGVFNCYFLLFDFLFKESLLMNNLRNDVFRVKVNIIEEQ